MVAQAPEVCETCGRLLLACRYRDEHIELDIAARTLKVHGVQVEINGHPLEMISCLVKNRGIAVSSLAILKECWGSEDYDLSVVKWNTSQLRTLLGGAGCEHQIIATVRGYGYRYDG